MSDYLGYGRVEYAEKPEDDVPTTDEWVERCPVCEGVDFPGLSHNPKAPYCNAVEIE